MLALLVIAAASKPPAAASQEKQTEQATNPLAGNPEAIPQGRSVFRSQCAICHGLDGRGGNRGPDLTTGVWVHGSSDAAIFATIARGAPGTEMPANDLLDEEIWAIVAYLRSLSSASEAPPAGNRDAGEKIFFVASNCSLCHMVNGRGGLLGPDLSRVGAARGARYLAEKIRNPNKEVIRGYETVSVVKQDGKRITGVRKNEDTFSIQLMDTEEQLHLLLKKNLREVIHEPKSVMPVYNESLLDEQQLRDLTAYLGSLRAR